MAIKETIPFSFDEIYNYVANKFVEAGYDYQEGSNTMQLVTAMSYLTSMLNANTAININELLLTLAQKRDMVLRDARLLGYEIEHKRSYQYELTLQFENTTNETITKKILKYTSFESNGKFYYYFGPELEFQIPPNSTITKNIVVKEGILKTYKNEPTLNITIKEITDENGNVVTQNYIDIPFTDIEDNGLEVFLTYYDEFGNFYNQELWTRSKSFIIDSDIVLNKEYVRLDNIDYNMPRIYFKLGDVGKELRVGTLIQINALQSSGSQGKLTDIPKPVELDAQVLNYNLVLQGADEESIESIKFNAPLFHNTANRIVTVNDYKVFCNRLTKVKDTIAWDGNSQYPQKPGHIWLSFLNSLIDSERNFISNDTKTYFELQNITDDKIWYIEQVDLSSNELDSDIQEIFDFIENYKIPTLILHHRNPVFLDFDIFIKVVKYNTAKTKAEYNQEIFDVINSYFKGFDENGNKVEEKGVESFNYEFLKSNLIKRISSKITDLMGFEINISTSIPISTANIIREEPSVIDNNTGEILHYYHDLIFDLGFPFEDFGTFETALNFNNLPDISATIGSENLYVDFTQENILGSIKAKFYPIRLGTGTKDSPNSNDQIVGYYYVSFKFKTINVKLQVITTNGYTNGIPLANVQSGFRINVSYPSNNYKIIKNTIARLKSVNFI